MTERRRIEQLGIDEVARVEGLWKELATHHGEVTEERWPTRDLGESWEMRRAQYVGWLGNEEAVMFVVPGEGDGAPLGYACLRVERAGPTWDLGEVVGDLETLSVAKAARGAGVGSALISHCRDHLAALGARWWGVSVLEGNDRAAALYEREGFHPFVHHLIAPIE